MRYTRDEGELRIKESYARDSWLSESFNLGGGWVVWAYSDTLSGSLDWRYIGVLSFLGYPMAQVGGLKGIDDVPRWGKRHLKSLKNSSKLHRCIDLTKAKLCAILIMLRGSVGRKKTRC